MSVGCNMKKMIITIFMCISMVLFLAGCNDESTNDNLYDTNDDNVEDENIKTMTAEEFANDLAVVTDGNVTTMGYGSLEDKDTVAIQDTIDNISYDSENDMTTIKFSSEAFYFEGDISNEYQIGDEVKITDNITHVTAKYGSTTYDMEMLENYWEDEQYFTSHLSTNPYKPLPSNIIQKV